MKLVSQHLKLVIAAIALAASTTLTSCTEANTEPKPPANQSTEPQSITVPQFVPNGTAEQNLPFFAYKLNRFVESDEPKTTETLTNYLAGQGFSKEMMQVSADTTKTGLQADQIYVSVRVNEFCLLGQVSTTKERASASVQPTVGPEKTQCLIGNTVPITW